MKIGEHFKECYMYYDGRMVFTYDGSKYFTTDQFNNRETINKVNFSKVAYKVK